MPKRNDDFFKEKKSWSEVKDELLGCYLIPYFNKIFWTGKPILYIDGFSGKGKFEDGKNGSPLIAWECFDHSLLLYQGRKKPTINMKFIDLNHTEELDGNLSEKQKEHSEVISGKFEEKIACLLQIEASKNPNQNVFLYIDPYGVKALDVELLNTLPSMFETVELLINLNTWGFFRMALGKGSDFLKEIEENLDGLDEYESSKTATIEELNTIAGGDYWQEIITRLNNKMIGSVQAEKEFSQKYKLSLNKRYKYVLDMPIRLKTGQLTKYRMVYATNHHDGCVLMADNIAKRADQLVVEIQNHGQMSLDLYSQNVENEIVSQEVIVKKLKNLLEKFQNYARINVLLADFYNEYGVLCDSTKVIEGLRELEKCSYIIVKRTPHLTDTGKVSSFWRETSGKDRKTVELKQKKD